MNLIGDYLYKYIYKYILEIKQVSDYDAYIRSIQSLCNSINSLFYFSNNLQLIDNTNPLSEISQKRRLTLSNHPGFPSEGQLLEKRDVHPTDFGRVCSIESPQGKKLGFNLYLAKDARISSLGTIETPFKNIDNGEEINLDPFDESEKVKAICTAGPANDKQGTFIKGPNGEVTLLCKNDSITHETITNHSFLGYSASLIPFIQHNDGGRALMGANMMKQAVLLRNPEPPLVKTGFEAVIAKKYDDQSKNPFIKNNQLCLGRNFLVAFVVNNIPQTVSSDIKNANKYVQVSLMGPAYPTAYGVERFQWDQAMHKWSSVWARFDVSSTSMVPIYSQSGNMALINGYRPAYGWEVLGLDWNTGDTVHHTIFGDANLGNGAYAILQYLENGDLLFNSICGPLRVTY